MPILAVCATTALFAMAGCGYHFQESHNPLLDLGIHRIYVKNFQNMTYRPGLEQYFTTAMVREIGHSKSFDLVNSEKDADAVLSGTITSADEGINSSSGLTVGTRGVAVATEYNATVGCSVTLTDRRKHVIFKQAIAGVKSHPGAGAMGDPGATAPLINDSNQRLAVQYLADQMMASVYQRMIDTF
jgi:outer membrane lipopolysaccharide assembly protein LptE/RlpB